MPSIMDTQKEQRLEEVLLEAQKELDTLRREVDKYKLVFDSARMLIGHEYIKPLTAISGYIELLQAELGENLGEKEQRYVGKVGEAITRLEELIDSTVQMLRMGTRVEKIYTLEQVNARDLVESVRSRFGDRAGRIQNLVPAELVHVAGVGADQVLIANLYFPTGRFFHIITTYQNNDHV